MCDLRGYRRSPTSRSCRCPAARRPSREPWRTRRSAGAARCSARDGPSSARAGCCARRPAARAAGDEERRGAGRAGASRASTRRSPRAAAACSTRSPRSPACASRISYEGQAAIELEMMASGRPAQATARTRGRSTAIAAACASRGARCGSAAARRRGGAAAGPAPAAVVRLAPLRRRRARRPRSRRRARRRRRRACTPPWRRWSRPLPPRARRRRAGGRSLSGGVFQNRAARRTSREDGLEADGFERARRRPRARQRRRRLAGAGGGRGLYCARAPRSSATAPTVAASPADRPPGLRHVPRSPHAHHRPRRRAATIAAEGLEQRASLHAACPAPASATTCSCTPASPSASSTRPKRRRRSSSCARSPVRRAASTAADAPWMQRR